MQVDVKAWTYEEMPDYSENVPGAKEIEVSGEEMGVTYIRDVVYDRKEDVELHLQLLVPSCMKKPEAVYPCVIYVQGSAWMKQNVYGDLVQIGKLSAKGYVCAVVEYRHSGIAKFPAPVIDAKNAARFLIAHAAEYHIDSDHLIFMGNSSGGQVAALAGMTCTQSELDEPGAKRIGTAVKGIVDLYGAVDLLMPCGFPSTVDHQKITSPEGMEMGFDLLEHPNEAKKACAVTYVSEENRIPPVLILHGTKDRTVFCEESVQFYKKLKACGKDAELYLMRGADHGGAAFWSEESLKVIDRFIRNCLWSEK